jgi:hypothetical protein
MAGRANASASLGYVYFIVFFVIVAAIVQGILLVKKVLIVKTPLDFIAMILAMPGGLMIFGIIISLINGLK